MSAESQSSGAERSRVGAHLIAAMSHLASSRLDEHGLCQRLILALHKVFPAERVELVLPDGENRIRFFVGPAETGPVRAVEAPIENGLHAQVLALAVPVLPAPGGEDPRAVAEGVSEPFCVCVPVPGVQRCLGSLLLARPRDAFGEDEVALLRLVACQVGIALDRARLLRLAAPGGQRLAGPSPPVEDDPELRRVKVRRARWLAALGELAAGVAHELKNVLHPIVAYAELIAANPSEPEIVRTYADRILQAARDGAETVARIQRFTRRQRGAGAGTGNVASLAAVVEDALNLALPEGKRPAGTGAIVVHRSVPADLAAHCNPRELRQALLNLVSNAVDAMPSGGELRLVAREEQGEAVVGVQDTGMGMPAHELERALEPFFTTKGEHGTGLGLSEVYGIIRKEDGAIEIESWPDVGTTVVLRLPLAVLPAGEPEPPPRGASAGALQQLAILLVEDNVLNLEAIAAALRAHGQDVTTVTSAERALELFEPRRFDLLLTDIGLPGLSGWDLVDRLRELDPGLPVGVVTGWAVDEPEESAGRDLSMVLIKPVDTGELLQKLRGIPRRRRDPPPAD